MTTISNVLANDFANCKQFDDEVCEHVMGRAVGQDEGILLECSEALVRNLPLTGRINFSASEGQSARDRSFKRRSPLFRLQAASA